MSKSLLLVATLFPTAITLVALLGSSSQAHRSGWGVTQICGVDNGA